MGDAIDYPNSIIWLEKLVWETFLGCMESSASILMWIVRREWNSHTFEAVKRSLDQLKSLMIHILIDWSQAWVFTLCYSIFEFQNSLRFSP